MGVLAGMPVVFRTQYGVYLMIDEGVWQTKIVDCGVLLRTVVVMNIQYQESGVIAGVKSEAKLKTGHTVWCSTVENAEYQ